MRAQEAQGRLRATELSEKFAMPYCMSTGYKSLSILHSKKHFTQCFWYEKVFLSMSCVSENLTKNAFECRVFRHTQTQSPTEFFDVL